MGWKEDGEPWYDETDEDHGPAIKAVKALPPVIKKEFDKIAIAKQVVQEYQRKLRDAEFELRCLQDGQVRDFKKRIAEAVKVPYEHIYWGSWECLHSPTGSCFYNGNEDQCLDFCLLCGGPDERK